MGECLIMCRGGEIQKVPVLNAIYPLDVSKTVIEGKTESATFNVLISEPGNPSIYTYQWYVDGVAVNGATNFTYTISDLSITKTYSIYCEVTNAVGTVQSRTATLQIEKYYKPTLDASYPQDITVPAHTEITSKIIISTEGNPSNYTYQWYKNNTKVNGATSSSYTFTPTVIGTTTVYCEITNIAGTVRSRTATLTASQFYLYNSGDPKTSITGGWSAYAYSHLSGEDKKAPTLTMNATNMSIAFRSAGEGSSSSSITWRRGSVWTNNPINLTNVSTITARIDGLDFPAGGVNSEYKPYCYFMVTKTKQDSYTAASSVTITGKGGEVSAAAGTYSIDVSSLSGNYYILFANHNTYKTTTLYVSQVLCQ